MKKAGARGILITFEGTEGAGKSTLIRAVKQKLTRAGIKTHLTREPGGVPLAEKIRSLILNDSMNVWTEIFLYEAARSEHLAKIILPAMKKKKVVLCDRFTDSTLAYQGAARGLPWERVKKLNDWATQGVRPDLTIFLDIDPAIGLKRARETTRFEKEGIAFQKKVRLGFLKARKENPTRWLTLDMNPRKRKSPEECAQPIVKAIYRKLGKKIK